jgi:acetyl-CoA C-acetyltransferase
MLTHRFMHMYGTTPEQLASVAVTARKYAAQNPDAVMRKPITVDDVLSSPVIATPVHRLDCCIITDGGGALVLTTPERAQSLRKPPIWVRGFGEGVINSRGGHSDWIADYYELMGAASKRAYEMAGIAPKDIDVAEIYDAFTIATLQGLEATGLVPKGEAGAFIESGAADPGGQLAVNPDGGGMCSNHPGRRGLFLLIDAVRQLRGEGAGWQHPDATNALISATGSAYMGVQGAAVSILSKER